MVKEAREDGGKGEGRREGRREGATDESKE